MKVNILGSEWDISFRAKAEDKTLEQRDGYADYSTKSIVVEDFIPDNDSLADLKMHARKIVRHEIVHAFLFESGLANCAYTSDSAWAKNEEMVDWIAFQGPKIYKAWHDADAL
ncbi:MAG: hypothetical protein K0M69_15790 [Youngiibacter sp.]|nr:hypothetical protein [Youngiibacter sp.]